MPVIYQIAWKELRSYFGSWLGYVLLAGWTLLGGVTWAYALPFSASFQPADILANMLSLLLFVMPLLTMRLLAEERRDGTLDVLLSSPLNEWQIALGKWLGALGFFLVMLLATVHFPLLASRYGTYDVGPVWGAYVALSLCGMAFGAWGLACSSWSESPIVAALLCFGGLSAAWLLGYAPLIAPGKAWAQLLAIASPWTHCEPLLRGLIDTRDVLYFASLCVFCLFLTVRALESRRWN